MPGILAFALCTLLFLLSLLVILRAPTYLFWKVAVGVTEFPYIPVTLTLLSIWFIRYTSGPLFENGFQALRDVGTLLGMAALILFARPIVQGVMVAYKFSLQFKENENLPFAPHRMFRSQKRFPKPQTLVYKKTNGLELSLDLYSTTSDYDRPCVVVIHGGGWDSGNNKQIDNLNYFLTYKGYHVAAINYRLAPNSRCPAPVEDLEAALEYLRSRASELNINEHNIILLGRSAGGQIALLAAYTALKEKVRGVISFYAPADMVWGWSIPGNPLVLDSRAVMSAYIGGTCEAVPEKFHASSPIEFVSSDSPPTLLIHGTNDCMVSPKHSTRLKAKLEQHKVDHLLVTLPWATHGCDFNLYGPSGQISAYAIERFLEKHTR